MLKSAKLASVVMLTVLGACAVEEDDSQIEPACESDEKCDSASSEGFEIFKGADGKYYFHLVSANGKIVMRSQGYTTKASATKGVESVRTNGVEPENFKLLQATSGQWYFNLYAQNHEIIGSSETYTRKFNATRGLDTTVDLIAEAQHIRAARSGARFQTFVGADHQTYFHLRAKNGEVMLASEGYLNGASAVKATESVRTNGKIAARYQILKAADGQWFFNLRAANNEVIGHSETYVTKDNAERAVSTLVAMLKSELVADPKPIAKPSRSIADKPALAQALSALSDVAAGGSSLAFFGAAEQVAKPADVSCHPGTVSDAQSSFETIATAIVVNGDSHARPDLSIALIEQARVELGELLGSDSYQICDRELSGAQTRSSERFVLSQASGGPRLVLQLGYDE